MLKTLRSLTLTSGAMEGEWIWCNHSSVFTVGDCFPRWFCCRKFSEGDPARFGSAQQQQRYQNVQQRLILSLQLSRGILHFLLALLLIGV